MLRNILTSAGSVLALFAAVSVANAQMASHDMPMEKDIVEVAAEAGTFNTLIAAAQAAGLVEALKGDGPLTVFAPTDEAFAKLPAGTVEELLKPENKDKLAKILLYHVVPGKVTSAEVVNLTSAKSLEGDMIDITIDSGNVYVDDAQVIAVDVEASNGVIHVIDAVILPSM
jgi:transforming growth factor-beta-induced protein